LRAHRPPERIECAGREAGFRAGRGKHLPSQSAHPVDAPYWDEVAGAFIRSGGPTLWRAYCDGLHADLIAEWLGDLQAHRALKTDLFDEAIGEGLVHLLAERSAEVHGVDVSPRVVAAAAGRCPDLRAGVADVRELDYPDGHFDLVLSNSTLDHFPAREDLARSLEEIHRVLAPGGRLLITLDNLANPVIALRRLLPFKMLNRLGLSPFYVGATLTQSGLREHLIRAGFEVEDEKIIMHVPRVIAIWICHALDSRARRPLPSRFPAALTRLEGLSRWPSRSLTGYYAAALARKRPFP